jgi:ubiquinone/menaquinone biosynthesis C-methylase UbiE
MNSRIAQEAHTGFAASSAYDTYRPSYPAEAVSQLLSALRVAGVAGTTIADLAAGTGKFTELLAARPEQYKIIAVEPHDGMREQLEKKNLRGLTVLNGTTDDMSDIADGSLDALVVAQVSPTFAHASCWP